MVRRGERTAGGGNLPAELSGLIGRRAEVAEVRRILSGSRLVTLTGVGGVGKTRLAQRVATELRRTFPDGAWFVDLAELSDRGLLAGELRDPELLAQVVSTVLGLREGSARPPLEMLSRHLAGRRLLLVLDNCEHVLDPVAALAYALLRASPGVRILATSREPVNIAGEAIFVVAPLATPEPSLATPEPRLERDPIRYDAVALFVARAEAALPDFRLTVENQQTVAEICRRLDGLPLAIELAAVRVRSLAPQQILERVTDRFALLGRGSRTAAERQQTLRACVDWSFELCAKPERTLWNRLAIFTGSFELDAAEGICAGDDVPADEVLNLIASMVDKSVLVREEHSTGVRYRMLETVRAYGQDNLVRSGEYEALRRRHRDWYERLAARARDGWISDRQGYWLARLAREHPNLRAAVEFCLSEPGEAEAGLRIVLSLPALYWWSPGLFGEGRRWLDLALAQTTGVTVPRARALLLGSRLGYARGEVDVATRLLAEGQDYAERLDAGAEMSFAAFIRGTTALFRNQLAVAVDALEHALALLPDTAESDLDQRLHVLFTLVVAVGVTGDEKRAVAYYDEAERITEPRGEAFHRSSAMWARGVAAWCQDDLREAVGYESASLRLKQVEGLDDPLGTALCLEVLAWAAASGHRYRRAATLLGCADPLWTEVGSSITSYGHLIGYHDACHRRSRAALGEAAYQDAYRHGAGLTLGETLVYALDEPHTEAHAEDVHRAALTPLTQREQEVAGLVARGLSNKEIAGALVISRRTAESHVENVLTKLGFTSRAQIAAWAVERRRDP